MGLSSVAPGWGPNCHLGPDNQKERENHPSLLQGRDKALSSPLELGQAVGTLPGYLTSTASVHD